jgi:Protein of unknown function (DUF2726)
MAWTLLLIGLLIAIAAYALFAVSRTTMAQRARSQERAAALLVELQARSRTATAPKSGSLAEHAQSAHGADPLGRVHGAGSGPRAQTPAAPVSLRTLRRPRLLTDAQRLLYLLVRSALPDHIVLANMRAVDMLDLPAGPEALAGDPRLAALLHRRLDCVVCRADLTPIAALVIDAGSASGADAEQETSALLRELSVRFLRIRSDSLPRPAAMRTLILG